MSCSSVFKREKKDISILIAVYLLGAYGPSGWSGMFIKALILIVYLGFSWRITLFDLRRFIWSTVRELLIRR